MAEPRSIRERERQLASRAKAEEAARQKRRAATTKRGGQVLETYQPDTITGTLYEGLASGIGGLGRLFGASERAATQRGRDAVENLKVLTEGLYGPEEAERSFRRIAGGRGGAEDYVLAGLTVAPVPGAVRRAAGRVGKRVAGKARNLAAKAADTRLGRYMTESRAIPEINTRTAFSTSERVPYVGSGHLSGVVGGSDAIKARYSSDPRASWANRQGGDILHEALGMRQKPMQQATGFYTPPGGELEINPATVGRPIVDVSGGAVSPRDRELLDLSEGLRAYIDAQGAGAWHAPIADAPLDELSSVYVPLRGRQEGPTLQALQELGGRYGLGDVVDTGEGVTLANFYPGPPPAAETAEALRGQFGDELAALAPGIPMRVKIDSGYQSMFEDAGGEGSGVATDRLAELLANYTPEDIANLDRSTALRKRAASGAALDEQMAREGLGIARPDIQRARRIIAERGITGLMDARKAGVALPSIAALMAAYGLQPAEGEMQDVGY